MLQLAALARDASARMAAGELKDLDDEEEVMRLYSRGGRMTPASAGSTPPVSPASAGCTPLVATDEVDADDGMDDEEAMEGVDDVSGESIHPS